ALLGIEIALRPTVPRAMLEDHDLLGRQLEALIDRVKLGPVLVQLIAAVLRDEEAPGGIEVEALAVANARGIALLGREHLIGLAGVVAPDASARLELVAGIVAGRMRHAVLHLARVRCRAHGDEEVALGIDSE